MSLPGLAAALVLALIVIVWVILPLLRRTDQDSAAPVGTDAISRQRDRLTLYYSRVLRNIHDLDEDFAVGKLNESEYRQEREIWAQRGVAALQALDSLTQQDAPPLVTASAEHLHEDDILTDDAALDASIEAAIEAAVQKQRAQL